MILIDAGPLVALVHADDQWHHSCVRALKLIREPMATVWPAFTEAMYLLGFSSQAQDALWEMVARRALGFLPLDVADGPRMRELMRNYRDRPMDLADAALADKFGRFPAKIGRAPVNANLHDAPVAPRGLQHGATFRHAQRERLLDIDILARGASFDHLERVPVVGGADDHGIHILQFEQTAVVLELLRLAADLFRREVEVRLAKIANRDHLGVLVGEKGVQHLVAAVTQPDEAEADALIGSQHARLAKCGGGAGHGQRLGEISAGPQIHGCVFHV